MPDNELDSQTNQPSVVITKQQLTDNLWATGDIFYKFKPCQMKLFEGWKHSGHVISIWHCARQLGKSYTLATLAIQECLKVPRTKVLFLSHIQSKLSDYITPILNNILTDCPLSIRPEYNAKNQLKFDNGSIVLFYGSNSESYQDLRGQGANTKLIIIDEAGFIDSLRELMELLAPIYQRNKARVIISSSSPLTTTHPFATMIPQAIVEGRYIKLTIHDDDTVSPQQIEEWAIQMGGKQSSAFRREYLCEITTDENRVVVPEWSDIFKIESSKPITYQFYKHYIGLDSGYRDFTAITFATYYFKEGYLQFEGELQFLEKEVRSDLIIPKVTSKAKELWGDNWKPYYCIADSADPIFINELNKYELMFYGVEKKSLRAMVNDFRVQVGATKIRVSKECTYLLSNLNNAIWTKDGDKIDKDTFNHHFDHLMASIYLSRYVNWNLNPIPNTFQVPTLPGTDMIPPWVMGRLKQEDPNQKAFKHLIKFQEDMKPKQQGPVKL